ncbi:DNA sulfur modification protein DndE [Massilia sp. MB5]|uniref:DNA sulfur modification protein DndE n=1 Tax=Massilia sp. MB5 TaxID=2919578 RepID=UPI001F0D7B3A|nr:DNA sulfur modification protein DndE [Massilia sp. MB5]UMR29721.1 DNA sulfur modification protein DndE [Massilia sp. MB5]
MTPIESIRLSEKAKLQLITMKRRTGIANWNVICRWAFCLSMQEKSIPPDEVIPADSSIEMSWRTFAGQVDQVYLGMLLVRAARDGVPMEKQALAHYFRLHLHRGISYLTGVHGAEDLQGLLALAPASEMVLR